jgi:hypothetical protein
LPASSPTQTLHPTSDPNAPFHADANSAGKKQKKGKKGDASAAEGAEVLLGDAAFITQDEGADGARKGEGATAGDGKLSETIPMTVALNTSGKHEVVGDMPFLEGTWGKWNKFQSESGGRARRKIPTPAILQRKPKFSAIKYVTKKQNADVEAALQRAKIAAAGIAEIERPMEERRVPAEAARHRRSKIKTKSKWTTRAVQNMLKDILSTEDSKLRALETQLHRASEDLARSGAAVYTLDSYRQSIQKIRRRIADLREATAFVKKETWLKDITRLLISSAVPLDKFLDDAQRLKDDGKFLIDDLPWEEE